METAIVALISLIMGIGGGWWLNKKYGAKASQEAQDLAKKV
jgi:uncharacterized membrane protein YhfC